MTKVKWTKKEQREHRKIWIDALRSGKYVQIQNQLHSFDNEYCAIGLGLHLTGIDYETKTYEYAFKSYYGLKSIAGRYNKDNVCRSILSDNDNWQKSFTEIADIIESEPEGLLED